MKNSLKCFTRKITKGYLRKLHKITITTDLIKIIFGPVHGKLHFGLKLELVEFPDCSNRAKSLESQGFPGKSWIKRLVLRKGTLIIYISET